MCANCKLCEQAAAEQPKKEKAKKEKAKKDDDDEPEPLHQVCKILVSASMYRLHLQANAAFPS
jgi:hypothetical protein